MTRVKFTFVLFQIFFIAFTSCNLTPEDPLKDYSEWKIQNDKYFSSMKDSVDYTSYIVPDSGGLGYYYKIIIPGDQNSISPVYNSYVKVNYRGGFIDGKVFEQTYKTSSTSIDGTANSQQFYANKLIYGWTSNLIQMKVGEVRRIVLPYQLAYGSSSRGAIKPYSTLIFDIQLISYDSN